MTAWGSRVPKLPMGNLQNKRAVGINWHLRAVMLDISRPAAKVIEAHAVGCRINQIEQPRAEAGPLRRVQLTLEYRELDADTEVLAGACHATQTSPSLPGKGADVIGNEHEHSGHREIKGGYPSRSPRRCAAISRACSCHRSPTTSRSSGEGMLQLLAFPFLKGNQNVRRASSVSRTVPPSSVMKSLGAS